MNRKNWHAREEGALSDVVQRLCEQRVDDGVAAKEG